MKEIKKMAKDKLNELDQKELETRMDILVYRFGYENEMKALKKTDESGERKPSC
jgi:hypothetical protein